MSEKHVKSIVETVEQNEVYTETMKAIPDKEKANVKATLDDFAKLLSPMVEALEQLEASEEIAHEVRARLAEKLRGR